jgi:serine/threonine protein kinase
VYTALKHLHKEHNMCHRDLKTENCLLQAAKPSSVLFGPVSSSSSVPDAPPQDQTYHLKLADLGIAKQFAEEGGCSGTIMYTPTYRAPEMQAGLKHTLNLDVWLLGALVLECRSSLPPFDHLNRIPGLGPEEKMARRGAEELAREDCPYRKLLTPEELDFASMCLERDADKRPYVTELMSKPSFRKFLGLRF